MCQVTCYIGVLYTLCVCVCVFVCLCVCVFVCVRVMYVMYTPEVVSLYTMYISVFPPGSISNRVQGCIQDFVRAGDDVIPRVSAASRGVWGHAPPEKICILGCMMDSDAI